MSHGCTPAPCPDDLARRYDKVREWLVDALAIFAAALTVMNYNPDGVIAMIVVFIGAYAVAHYLGDVIWLTSPTWLVLLTILIYVCTYFYTSSHLPLLAALLLTIFLPGIAQAYVIWDLWPATSHPLPLFCTAWLVLLAICIFEPTRFRRLTSRIKARRSRK